MLGIEKVTNVYLAIGATDMRKSIDGLAIKVEHEFELDPFSSSLYVFCNKRKDKIKMLYWSGSGFWLLYKRLEKDTFMWIEQTTEEKTVRITPRQLGWLLEGLSPVQDKAHKEVTVRNMI